MKKEIFLMKRKSIVITLIIALIIGILTTSSSALSFTATMTPSSTTVPESTEFTIVIKVSNLDVGSNGINSLNGYLKYDSKIFETISDSSLEGLNGWTTSYNADNGKIILVKNSFVKSDQEVLQITFKTKSDVSGQSGAISFSNIVASNSESDISASDISTTITVGTNTVPSTNTNTNTSGNTQVITPTVINPTNSLANAANTNTETSNTSPIVNGSVNNNTNNTKTNSVSSDEMPYTGVEDVALRAIFVVLVIAAISYFKYESMKDVK
jgi:hypothetical protein